MYRYKIFFQKLSAQFYEFMGQIDVCSSVIHEKIERCYIALTAVVSS